MGSILLLRRELIVISGFLSITFFWSFSVALIVIIVETTFFQRKFGVSLSQPGPVDKNDPQLHMIAYLQVAIISQALIFVTRSHGFFFMERPSFALLGAFGIAQLVSSIIAAYGDWGFTQVHSISGGWIGIVWVWVSLLINFNQRHAYIQTPLFLEYCLVFPIGLDQVCHEANGDQVVRETSFGIDSASNCCRCSTYARPVPCGVYS